MYYEYKNSNVLELKPVRFLFGICGILLRYSDLVEGILTLNVKALFCGHKKQIKTT
jgi:hypothetical protein